MEVVEVDHVPSDPRHLLPSEIILFQILPRLPAKSLMRFKCVCKTWSSFIRDPFFVRAHRNMHNSQNNHTTHLLLTDGGSMRKPEKPKRLFSMQLINQGGMICSTPPLLLSHNLELPSSSFTFCCRAKASLISINSVDQLNDLIPAVRPDRVHIFNPCTREFIALPVSEYDSALVSISDAYNTYDIGFSTLTDVYKVLEIHVILPAESESPREDASFMFKIFTLGTTTSWRDVQQETDVFDDLALDSLLFDESVCIHGAMHWIQRTIKEKSIVLVFDFGEERFRVIPCPEDYICDDSFYWGIVEVNGCLAVYTKDLWNERVMELRILKDYQNQVWVKESIIFPDKWRKLGQPIPVCSIHTGELLLQQTRHTDQGSDNRSVHLYDMKANSYKKVEISVPGSIIASYDETIVSLR